MSAFKDILGFFLAFITSTKYFFKKEFTTELYYKHFSYSLVLTLPCIAFLMIFAHLKDTPLLFQCFIGGGGAFTVNWVRELIKEDNAKKEGWKYPFDYVDVYFGTYGGIVAAIIIHYFLMIL